MSLDIITKRNHLGLDIEYVQFSPVNPQQVQHVADALRSHQAAINARQSASPATAAAAYQKQVKA